MSATDSPEGIRTPTLHKFYLTFGVKYRNEVHPYWVGADPDGWVLIEAETEDAARALAVQYLDKYWAFLYPANRFDVDRYRQDFYPKGQVGHLTPTTEGII